MITDKAKEVAQKAIQAYDSGNKIEGNLYSMQAWRELIDNCEPTKKEFIAFSHGLLFDGGTFWELVTKIPQWEK